jgi:hypothetical protein
MDNTKQKFEVEEIKEYLLMALDEYISCLEFNRPLPHDKMQSWLKYKIFEYGNRALSIHWIGAKGATSHRRFRETSSKKAKIYASKSAVFFR